MMAVCAARRARKSGAAGHARPSPAPGAGAPASAPEQLPADAQAQGLVGGVVGVQGEPP